ncbi:MAG: hypothetical protein PVJ21_15000 [Anaerolineales bacterium]|jgi:hypothetical protein
MIRWQRSIRARVGKGLEAVQWAKEVTDYVNSKQPDHEAQAFSSTFGDINLLVWHVDFEDLAALDKFSKFFETDQGYLELVRKAADLFIDGSVYDSAFESL